MMVVVTYDVDVTQPAGAKRLRRVARICESKGVRVQNSVFEVLVDQAGLTQLKLRLQSAIDPKQDSIRFYLLGTHYQRRIDSLGKALHIQQDGDLIL
ncbi:MAG: CRISPR-associated endonuclease Cas2 [Provencibacterium sp.]|nr:CRISPR-associated endonuclease Cas2 [Provencibacterium sp.]